MNKILGYISKTGHGTHFRETITPELEALTWEGRKVWTPVQAVFEHQTAPEPEPVAEVFDTFGNSQDPNKAVGHVRLKANYFPPKGTKLYAAPPAAPAPEGWVMVPGEPTPEMVSAMPYPANTIPAVGVECYHAMIAASPAAPVVPLTDEQLAKIAVEDGFLLYCDQDSFNEIARAIEAAHGITGASK